MTGVRTCADLVAWLRDTALPVWAERGFDAATGRFRERLDSNGAPLDVPHRSMVQARQIFVYAEAARLGWHVDGGERAVRAMAALDRDFAASAGGGTAFRFASHGPGADVHDSYGHAFVLLAIAALHRLAPSPALERLADRVLRHIDAVFVDPQHGGVFDAHPRASDAKRQNPVMHLLEALIALDEAMPGRGHLDRAAVLVDLFATRLCHPGHGAVIEHFGQDWCAHPDPALAGLVEPGHLHEWIWLLDRFARRAGRDLAEPIAALERAAAFGVTAEGRIVDALAAVDLAISARDHRLWPHTEAIKAATVRFRGGDPAAIRAADGFARTLGRDFLDRPFAGGWIDRVNPAGRPLTDEVPASSLYHLMLAGIEADAAFAPVASPAGTR